MSMSYEYNELLVWLTSLYVSTCEQYIFGGLELSAASAAPLAGYKSRPDDPFDVSAFSRVVVIKVVSLASVCAQSRSRMTSVGMFDTTDRSTLIILYPPRISGLRIKWY